MKLRARCTAKRFPFRFHAHSGFSLVELLLVLALLFVFAAAAVPFLNATQTQSRLDDTASLVVGSVRRARAWTVSGKNNAGHGVKVNGSSIILYEGDSYAAKAADELALDFGSVIQLTTTFLGDDIVFTKGSGTTTEGAITVQHASGSQKILFINSLGFVEEQ